MFYLVERKVAAATGETPIAVMGEVGTMCTMSTTGTTAWQSLVVVYIQYLVEFNLTLTFSQLPSFKFNISM